MKVAILGPAGTFSEEALLADPGSDGVEPVLQPSIFDCVTAVRDGRVERALVPIENSLEGSVNSTLDALVLETDNVRMVGEQVHPIRHCLIARPGTTFDSIERVISHPQATAQCARFLHQRLPDVEVVSAASTADAVRAVSEQHEPWAALGARVAAELYGCVVLQDDLDDSRANLTRFVWLARESGDQLSPRDAAGDWKTSIVFWGLPDAPGALVNALAEFADRDVNLTKIESRPLKGELGSYMFFADLQGSETDSTIVDALEALRESVQTLRVLGCYRSS